MFASSLKIKQISETSKISGISLRVKSDNYFEISLTGTVLVLFAVMLTLPL